MDDFSETEKEELKDTIESGGGPEDGADSVKDDLPLPAISKRAARRLIQRALVLAGRDRNVRQHIREAKVITLWVLEDWQFEWTAVIERGKVHFDRRPARAPDLTLRWPNEEEFFTALWEGRDPIGSLLVEGNLSLRRFSDPVYSAFCRFMQQVLRHPFDDAENPLI